MEKSSCGIMIKQIHDELERQSNKAMRSSDLTLAQVGALLSLRAKSEKQMPLKELEHKLRVAQSTAVGIVKRLEQKGFVESFGDPEDKRIKIIRITQTGEHCCQDADQGMADAEQILLSGLTETERDIFISLLIKVRDSFK